MSTSDVFCMPGSMQVDTDTNTPNSQIINSQPSQGRMQRGTWRCLQGKQLPDVRFSLLIPLEAHLAAWARVLPHLVGHQLPPPLGKMAMADGCLSVLFFFFFFVCLFVWSCHPSKGVTQGRLNPFVTCSGL